MSAWATSTSPPRSATSGSSRASRAASATCSTWLPRSSRRSCTSPRRSSPGSTRRRAGATCPRSRARCRPSSTACAAEEKERVDELQEVARGARRRTSQTGSQVGLRRRGPPVGRVARRQRQEALRRGAQEARQGRPEVVQRRHRRHRGLLRGRPRAPQGRLEALRQQGGAGRRPARGGRGLAAGAYTEKPIEKDEFRPKLIIADETFFRELKHRFGSPFGFGEYFGGGMGAEHIRELLREKAELRPRRRAARRRRRPRRGRGPRPAGRAGHLPRARARGPRGPGQERQGPEAGPRGQAPEGPLGLPALRATSPR